MKRLVVRLVLSVLMSVLCFSVAQAAITYPLQLSAHILPPYGCRLSDYVVQGMERLNLTVLQRDLRYSNYDFLVRMQVKQGTKIVISSTAGYTVKSGQLTRLNSANLFNGLTADITAQDKYKENGFCLNEGAYEFVFQAFDAKNTALPVSEPVYFHTYLSKALPPACVFPANGSCVDYKSAAVSFAWMEKSVSMPSNGKRYSLEVYEMPEGFDGTDRAENLAGASEPVYRKDDINGNITVHTAPVSAGMFIKGRTYVWRVRSYSTDFGQADSRVSGHVENNGYSQYSAFKFGTCVDVEDVWKKKDQAAIGAVKYDSSKKPVLESVDTSGAVAVVEWLHEPEKFCGYVVEWNMADTALAPWGQKIVSEKDSFAYISGLSYGVDYIVRLRGVICNGSEEQAYSACADNVLSFRLEKREDAECGNPVPQVTSLVSLKEAMKEGDVLSANGHDVTVLTCEMNVSGSDTTFTGTGLVSYGFLKSFFNLTVKFDNVKINDRKELLQGMVYANTDLNNCLDLNLNRLANKGSAGSGPAQRQTAKFDEFSSADNIPENKAGLAGGTMYAWDADGNRVECGTLEDTSCASNNLFVDSRHGEVLFDNLEGMEWNPPFDREKRPFDRNLTFSDYYENLDGYSVPWIGVPEGGATKVKATLLQGASVNPNDVHFVLRTGSQSIRLNAKRIDGNSSVATYEVPVFADKAGDKGAYLELSAVVSTGEGACSQQLVLGVAKVYAMKREHFNVRLVPCHNVSIDEDAIAKKLNEIYKPLGKTFTVTEDELFYGDTAFAFIADTFDVKNISRRSTETEDMTFLKYIYREVRGFSKDSVYLFVLPKANIDGVTGFMPRGKHVGYLFCGENETIDERTVAHELGHGLFTLEHAFDYIDGSPVGSTNNLMDYSDGTNLKVWQWNHMDTHGPVLPFFDDAEDGMYQPWVFEEGHIIEDFYAIPDEYLTFASSDGQKLVLPNEKTKMVRFVDGYVVSFVIDGELWHAITRGGHFVGYYKDAKAYKQTGEESYKVSTKGCLLYKMGGVNVNKDSVYIPLFTGEDRCAKPLLYKVQYVYQSDKNQTTRESEFNQLYDKVKAMNSQSEDAEIIGHYVSLGDNVLDFNINCLSDSQREFYLFMTYYYDYYTGCNCSNPEPIEKDCYCGELDERKKRLYSTIERYEIKIHGLDDTDNCSAEIDLSSNKGASIADFLKKIDHMNSDGGSLCVTLDNYSVFQDFYLKVFTPVKEKEPKCTQEQWESDLTMLENFKKAIKNKTNLKFTINGNVKNIVPGIYDFCDYIVFEVCKDYLHTVKYEIIEDYLRFIFDECCKDHIHPIDDWKNFDMGVLIRQFNTSAENASLYLMRAININDLDKFANFLAGEDSKYRVLSAYMRRFDDAMIDIFDDNGYTGFMRVLVTMFRNNPKAFGANLSPYDLDVAISKYDTTLTYEFVYDEENGKVTMISEETDENGIPYVNKVNVSPFEPIYITIKKDAPSISQNVASGFASSDDKGNYQFTCPIIFYKYYKDKVFNSKVKSVTITAGVAVTVVALAPGLVVAGGPAALEFIANKVGKDLLVDFVKGAVIGGVSYALGQYIFGEDFKTEDCLYHSMLGGVNNLINRDHKKLTRYVACLDAMDLSSVYSCVTTAVDFKDITDQRNCPLFKSLLECGVGVLLERVTENSDKLKDIIKKSIGDRIIRRELAKKFSLGLPKVELSVYEILGSNKVVKGWANDCSKIIDEFGEKGFNLIKEANVDYGILTPAHLRNLSEFVKDADNSLIKQIQDILRKHQHSYFFTILGWFHDGYYPKDYVLKYIKKTYKKIQNTQLEVNNKTISATDLFEESNIEKLRCFYNQNEPSILYKLVDMPGGLLLDLAESEVKISVIKFVGKGENLIERKVTNENK